MPESQSWRTSILSMASYHSAHEDLSQPAGRENNGPGYLSLPEQLPPPVEVSPPMATVSAFTTPNRNRQQSSNQSEWTASSLLGSPQSHVSSPPTTPASSMRSQVQRTVSKSTLTAADLCDSIHLKIATEVGKRHSQQWREALLSEIVAALPPSPPPFPPPRERALTLDRQLQSERLSQQLPLRPTSLSTVTTPTDGPVAQGRDSLDRSASTVAADRRNKMPLGQLAPALPLRSSSRHAMEPEWPPAPLPFALPPPVPPRHKVSRTKTEKVDGRKATRDPSPMMKRVPSAPALSLPANDGDAAPTTADHRRGSAVSSDALEVLDGVYILSPGGPVTNVPPSPHNAATGRRRSLTPQRQRQTAATTYTKSEPVTPRRSNEMPFNDLEPAPSTDFLQVPASPAVKELQDAILRHAVEEQQRWISIRQRRL